VPLEVEGFFSTNIERLVLRVLTFWYLVDPEVTSAKVLGPCRVHLFCAALPVASRTPEATVDALTPGTVEKPLPAVVEAATT